MRPVIIFPLKKIIAEKLKAHKTLIAYYTCYVFLNAKCNKRRNLQFLMVLVTALLQ